MTQMTDADARRALAARFDAATAADGDTRPFLETAHECLSYRDLGERVRRLTAAFAARGLQPGDRALVATADDAMAVSLFIALLRSGCTPVMADPAASAEERRVQVEIAAPAAVFVDAGPEPLAGLLDAAPVDPPPVQALSSEAGVIVFTSGTTSEPKAVSLGCAALVAQMRIFADVYGFDGATRLLNVLPLHHVDGLIRGPLAALWFGGAVLRPLTFGPATAGAWLQAAADQAATHLIAAPAMLGVAMRLKLGERHGDALRGPGFRFVISSADYLDAKLWADFEACFGAPVLNAYGLSEVVCDAVFAVPEPETRRIGALGRPVGCEAALLDEAGKPVRAGAVGELALFGPTLMTGYFGAPDATAAVMRDGWFMTGDYARKADDGLFEFVGRKKTKIVRAGVTIHPESVAEAVLAMPGVGEAAAFGAPDGDFGEQLVCCVAPAAGHVLAEADVAAFCRAHLAAERVPNRFYVIDALPRTAAGKIALAELASSISDAAAEAAAPGDVYRLAAEVFSVDLESLTPDSTPFDTEGWDSLAHIALIERIEAAFGFELSAVDIAGFGTLGDAEAIIEETLARAG